MEVNQPVSSITSIVTTEIFPEIFSYLPASDLTSLMLTCHKFNAIISQSTKLCSKFRVRITGDMRDVEWLANRKYQHYKLQFMFVQHNLISIFRALRKYGKNVTTLVIQESSITTEDLRDLLMLMPNLKKLLLADNYLRTYREGIIKRSKIEYIECVGLPIYLNMFNECQELTGLKMVGSDEINWPIAHYEEFLLKQKNLKRLKISQIDTFPWMFSRPNLSENAQFRLTHLGLENISFSEQNFENFLRFLRLHRDTLEVIEFSEFDQTFEVLDVMREFRNLKAVRIFVSENLDFGRSNIEPMENVENLVIQGAKFKNISKVFPEVTKLTLRKGKIYSSDLAKIKILQKLTFIECRKISRLQTETVKEISFLKCSFLCFSLSTNIEKMTLKNCKNVDWLKKFLHNSKNLQHLEICETKVSGKLVKILKEMEKKIDRVLITNVEKLDPLESLKNHLMSLCIFK